MFEGDDNLVVLFFVVLLQRRPEDSRRGQNLVNRIDAHDELVQLHPFRFAAARRSLDRDLAKPVSRRRERNVEARSAILGRRAIGFGPARRPSFAGRGQEANDLVVLIADLHRFAKGVIERKQLL